MNNSFNGYITYKSGNYIQIYKDTWNNQKYDGVHFEIVFNDFKLLGRTMTTHIVLHIERRVTEEQLEKFKQLNITKHGLQAYLNDKEIKITYELNFSNYDEINNSINTINQ